jgi:hypothetical protein
VKEFRCSCGWKYIVGKKTVYGPIMVGMHVERFMTRDEWEEDYADCVFVYRKRRRALEL